MNSQTQGSRETGAGDRHKLYTYTYIIYLYMNMYMYILVGIRVQKAYPITGDRRPNLRLRCIFFSSFFINNREKGDGLGLRGKKMRGEKRRRRKKKKEKKREMNFYWMRTRAIFSLIFRNNVCTECAVFYARRSRGTAGWALTCVYLALLFRTEAKKEKNFDTFRWIPILEKSGDGIGGGASLCIEP